MEERISWLLADISRDSIALPIIIGVFRYFRLNHVQKVILFLILLSVLTESVATWVVYQRGNQNLVYYLFTVSEYILLTYVFAYELKPFFKNGLFEIATLFFLVFVFADMVWISDVTQFNSYTTAIEGLVLIFFSLCFFYKTLQELKIEHLERMPHFWVSTGVLLYFASNLFIFLFTNYVQSSNKALFIIWGIHAIFSILLNVFYTITLWVKPSP